MKRKIMAVGLLLALVCAGALAQTSVSQLPSANQPLTGAEYLLSTQTISGTPTSVKIPTNTIVSWSTPLMQVNGGTYPGATSITTFGIVTSGTWHGTIVSPTYGGTGVNNGTSTITVGGNTAFSGAFSFAGTLTGTTAVTFPTSGTLATTTSPAASIVIGTTAITSGTSNGLLYDNAGVAGNLATANSGVLVTSSGGVPSISTTLPNGLAMGTPTSLTLTNATGLPLTTGVTGVLPIANGGTGAATTSQNFAFIGPTSGSGTPSFRALVAGDIPSLSGTYLPLAGGTMAGNIAMGGNNISGIGTINGNTWATGTGTLSIGAGKTFTASNTLTFTGTDSTSFAFPSTSDTVTGIAATQTLTNKTISGASNTISNIGNASLTNSSVTIAGSAVSLGGSITATTLTADLNVFTSLLQGVVPASGGGTANFLRADGSWATPPSTTYVSFSVACITSCGSITGSAAKVPFDTVGFDTGSYWNASTHVFTPLIAGKYKIDCQVQITNSGVSTGAVILQVLIQKNGSTVYGNSTNGWPATSTGNPTTSTSATQRIVQMNGSTDTLECDALSAAASPSFDVGIADTYFEGSYVGP